MQIIIFASSFTRLNIKLVPIPKLILDNIPTISIKSSLKSNLNKFNFKTYSEKRIEIILIIKVNKNPVTVKNKNKFNFFTGDIKILTAGEFLPGIKNSEKAIP